VLRLTVDVDERQKKAQKGEGEWSLEKVASEGRGCWRWRNAEGDKVGLIGTSSSSSC